jgi:hypothetical protein
VDIYDGAHLGPKQISRDPCAEVVSFWVSYIDHYPHRRQPSRGERHCNQSIGAYAGKVDNWRCVCDGEALIKRIPQSTLANRGSSTGPLLLLASEAGSDMTGSVIVADGGHLVSSL